MSSFVVLLCGLRLLLLRRFIGRKVVLLSYQVEIEAQRHAVLPIGVVLDVHVSHSTNEWTSASLLKPEHVLVHMAGRVVALAHVKSTRLAVIYCAKPRRRYSRHTATEVICPIVLSSSFLRNETRITIPHLPQDVTDNLALFVLCHPRQVGPCEEVIIIKVHIVVFRKREQVQRLYREDVLNLLRQHYRTMLITCA